MPESKIKEVQRSSPEVKDKIEFKQTKFTYGNLSVTKVDKKKVVQPLVFGLDKRLTGMISTWLSLSSKLSILKTVIKNSNFIPRYSKTLLLFVAISKYN